MHLKKELTPEDVTTILLKLSTPANMVMMPGSCMLSVVGYLLTFLVLSCSYVLFFIYLVVLVIFNYSVDNYLHNSEI